MSPKTYVHKAKLNILPTKWHLHRPFQETAPNYVLVFAYIMQIFYLIYIFVTEKYMHKAKLSISFHPPSGISIVQNGFPETVPLSIYAEFA